MTTFTIDELNQILNQHKLWLQSSGVMGVRAVLTGADLKSADLKAADLRRSNLQGADLRRADLREADLRGADLRGADLREANLYNAWVDNADLRGADFDMNILRCENFYDTEFTPDALPWLILHQRWPQLKELVRIEDLGIEP